MLKQLKKNTKKKDLKVILIVQLVVILIVQLVKNLPAMRETPDQFLGREDQLEKG